MKMHADIGKYSSKVQSLVEVVSSAAFDFAREGSKNASSRKLLSKLTPEELFTETSANSTYQTELAECCVSGLWLLHGFLDESHEISQSIKTPEGSYWHAIMHRAEGDFWNSKYWYRNVGDHPVLEKMNHADAGWTSESFVDLCEKASSGNDSDSDNKVIENANRLARIEWLSLFDHCWNAAQG